MDAGLVECFIAAAREVLGEMGLTVTRTATLPADELLADERSVVATVGIIGQLTGSFLLRLSSTVANNIVSAMYRSLGLGHRDPREATETAIAEVANQITGRAVTYLSRRSVDCDITPPAVITGMEVTSALPGIDDATYQCLDGEFGRVHILLGLRL